MNRINAYALVGLLLSGCHEYHNSLQDQQLYHKHRAERAYTVVVQHDECTYCGEALFKPMIPVPESLKKSLGDTLTNDALTLVGNFPHDLLDSNSLFFTDPSILTGKIIGIDTTNGSEWYPRFYVETWEYAN
ncbi:hypothetical protein Q5H92_05555 [Hymenobacter sp. M29]|uniref:Uncharacterized protein n=1 Tax=Hymenobacter mellowenesis TaxID=3063995 RepID=A0ABT9A7K1_9BACT|nr:hypothetical protein [Hymenobacter sp. M29]MDO7845814.1 hypothetical protein [Hymenobacter sp. M29]